MYKCTGTEAYSGRIFFFLGGGGGGGGGGGEVFVFWFLV